MAKLGRPKKDYTIKPDRGNFYLAVDGSKVAKLAAATREEAERTAPAAYAEFIAERAARAISNQPQIKPKPGSLRDGLALYRESDSWKLYKWLTHRQMNSAYNAILTTPAANGTNLYGESALNDWLFQPEAPDSVRRIMARCGTKAAAANHRLKAMNNFFVWLLGEEPQAAEARLALKIGKHARNPCLGIAKAKPKRGANGKIGSGHTPFSGDEVEQMLHAAKDDPEWHRAIRFELITGARTSDLRRLGPGMVKNTPDGRVLEYTCEKGKGSAFRESGDSIARVPIVPELQALIDEVPKGRMCFIHSERDRPYSCAESMGNRIRKWRRDAGLPEGLSAHGMRKAATHWWLRNHRDLIANNFSLKTIFGWMTDKELERYTRDFDRDQEARGMLIRLADRRKAAKG